MSFVMETIQSVTGGVERLDNVHKVTQLVNGGTRI